MSNKKISFYGSKTEKTYTVFGEKAAAKSSSREKSCSPNKAQKNRLS